MREAEQMNPNDPYSDDEIDLKELFQVLLEGKKLIILITAIFAIGSVVYSLSLNNHYKSESLFLARSASENQGLSQYSGLAAMAGVSLPSSGEDKAAQTIELIKFVRKNFMIIQQKLKLYGIIMLSIIDYIY